MGYMIKVARVKLDMTQAELAEKSGVSGTIINGLESGRVTVTTTLTLNKIAAALNTTVGELFAG